MIYDPEKTISEIFNVFSADAYLETFDIIPQPQKKEDSPVQHVEHNLGLESWCIKELYIFTHCQIFKPAGMKDKLALLTAASLLNPSTKTFWNMRRKLVLRNDLDLYSELRFIAIIITFKPKVPDVFNYRKWILQQIFEKRDIRPDLFTNEFRVVLNAAERFTNNHMAWDFAVWLLNWIEADENTSKVLEYFWNQSEKYISHNISDYSALNFRQQLIKKFLDSEQVIDSQFKLVTSKTFCEFTPNTFSSKNDLIEKNSNIFYKFGVIAVDLELNEKLICFFVNHEALWNHRRYLCYLFTKILPQKLGKNYEEILNEFLKCKTGDVTNLIDFIFSKVHESFLVKASMNNREHFVRNYRNWLKYLQILGEEMDHSSEKV